MNLAVWVLTALVVIGTAYATPIMSIRCYECRYEFGDAKSTDNCTKVTNDTPFVDCSPPKSCIRLMTFDLQLKFVKSVYRMCSEIKESHCTQDTCYDKCQYDKCNKEEAKLACDGTVCKNGGTCLEQKNGKYKCICVKGYTDNNCETDFNECQSNPCKNTGTCTDKVDGYECKCRPQYVGTHCQVRGVMCYTCSYVWTAKTELTRECVDAPENVTQGAVAIPCPHPRYCTVIRRFDDNLPNKRDDGKGDIRSYVRMCDTVNRGNYCVKNVNFGRETCYSTCKKSYCNTGDGDDDPKKAMNGGNTTMNLLDWPELFNYSAKLGSSTTTASCALVGLLAATALLNVWQ